MLDPAARQPGADATVRQNLALAHALAGDWDQARIIAAQDVPAGQLDARIQQWMQLAKPAHASDQVASLIGVTPAAVDTGQPVQLALDKGDTRVARRPAAVSRRCAAPRLPPLAAPVVQAAANSRSRPAPVASPSLRLRRRCTRPTHRDACRHRGLGGQGRSRFQSLPAASRPSHRRKPPTPCSAQRLAPPAIRRPSSSSAPMGRPSASLTAWDGAARKYAALKGLSADERAFREPEGTFYRLSVQGFNSFGEANSLCSSLRQQGGSCFVRKVAGDSPVQFASR